MAPRSRRLKFPQVVIERDSDTEESSEEEVEDQEDVESEEDEQVEEEEEKSKDEEKIQVGLSEKSKGKAPITISLKKVCKVCIFPLSHFIMYLCVCVCVLFFLSPFSLKCFVL